MFAGTGTLINIGAILAGSSIGVVSGSRFAQATRDLVTEVLGFVVLLAGADALRSLWSERFASHMPKGWTILTLMAALLLGAVLGTWWGIEARLVAVGSYLKAKFDRGGKHHRFVEGFVAASLVFAIGPLAILGSISDGMGTGTSQLVLKSMLDFFTSIAFASTLGWGVAASAIPVGIYQFAWTGIGFGLGSILSNYQMDAMTASGGVLLLGIGLRLMRIREVAVGNLIPAIFLAPAIALLVHQFQ